MKTVKTSELKAHLTWVMYNGTKARIIGNRPSTARTGLRAVTLDRYNMSGTKVATLTVNVSPDAVWIPITNPTLYKMSF